MITKFKNIYQPQRAVLSAGVAAFVMLAHTASAGTGIEFNASIAGSGELAINAPVTYDFSDSNNKYINFEVIDPFVCASVAVSSTNTSLVIRDEDYNATNSYGYEFVSADGVSQAQYDLTDSVSKLFNITSDGTIRCYTREDALTFLPDVIFSNNFELQALSNGAAQNEDIQVSLVDQNEQAFPANYQFADNQNLDYKYIISNPGSTQVTIDFSEYYSVSDPTFRNDAGNTWQCTAITTGSVTSCDSSNNSTLSGSGLIELSNAVIEPGDELHIAADRVGSVISPPGYLEILAAAFNKSGTDPDESNNVVYQSFQGVANQIPTISSVSNPTILEDGTTGTLGFTVADFETPAENLLVTRSSSDTSIVPLSNIVLGGTGSNRTVSVTPTADANTASGPVTITLTVSDGTSIAQSSFNLTVTPVNDKPVFTMHSIDSWAPGSNGLRVSKQIFSSLSMGASADEGSQTVLQAIPTLTSDPNGIIAVYQDTGEPQIFLTLDGDLSYVLTGQGGTASIDIVLQDDGGTANSGQDTSDPVTLSLTVDNTPPTISSVANQTIDEDSNTAALALTIGDAESAAADLDLSATSSNTTIIPLSGIQFTGTGENRFVTITPAADQNTSITGSVVPVTVTLIVDDGSDTTETTLDVTVNPINDPPTFVLAQDITWPAFESGLKQFGGFASSISEGPTQDEIDNQSIVEFIVTESGSSGIFSFPPVIDNTGSLAYALNGSSGVATINVQLQDDAGGDDTSPIQTFTITVEPSYDVNINVSGLAATNTVSFSNGSDTLDISANGTQTISTVADGTSFDVNITAQPDTPNQVCSFNNADSGTISGADHTVNVTCVTNTYTVSGTVSGATGSVSVQNNGGDTQVIPSNGAFSFTAQNDGTGYLVTVSDSPVTQTCIVSNGSGTLSGADVSNVSVACSTNTFTVGGDVSGLVGSVTLQNNGSDDIIITDAGPLTFTFPAQNDGTSYNVTVSSQPAGQNCSVSNDSGTLSGANVTNVAVTCVNTFTVGGDVSGLVGSVTLQNNGSDDIIITDAGPLTFTFPAQNDGTSYNVTISSQPAGQNCSVSNDSGTLSGANVTNVSVSCVNTFTVSGTVTGATGSVTLQNNTADDQTIALNGAFSFSAQDDGSSYAVTVSDAPGTQACVVTGGGINDDGTGTLAGANVTDVLVTCSTF